MCTCGRRVYMTQLDDVTHTTPSAVISNQVTLVSGKCACVYLDCVHGVNAAGMRLVDVTMQCPTL